jgi:hypothetical protein
MYQIDVPTLYTSEVVSGFINVGDLCLAKDHVVSHNVALESPTGRQNSAMKYYLTTAVSNSSKHYVSFVYCGLAQDESKLQLKVSEGGVVGWRLYYIFCHRIQFCSYRVSLVDVKFKISHKHTDLKLFEISKVDGG